MVTPISVMMVFNSGEGVCSAANPWLLKDKITAKTILISFFILIQEFVMCTTLPSKQYTSLTETYVVLGDIGSLMEPEHPA